MFARVDAGAGVCPRALQLQQAALRRRFRATRFGEVLGYSNQQLEPLRGWQRMDGLR